MGRGGGGRRRRKCRAQVKFFLCFQANETFVFHVTSTKKENVKMAGFIMERIPGKRSLRDLKF